MENVVAACERIKHVSLSADVTQKALLPVLAEPTRHREVDVLVRVAVADRIVSIGVEVRARGAPLDVPDLGALLDLKAEVGLDRLCVVSTKGFTSGARTKAAQAGVQLVTPGKLDDTGVFPSATTPFVQTVGVYIGQVDVPPHLGIPWPRLVGARLDEIELVTHAGDRVPLLKFLHARCAHAVITDTRAVPHGAPVQVDLVELPTYFAAILVATEEGPVPAGIRVYGRCERTPIAHLVVRLFGMELATFVAPMPATAELRQWTLAAHPAPSGSGRRISITTGAVQPRPTRLRPERRADDCGPRKLEV